MKKRTYKQFNQIVAVLLVFVNMFAIVILIHFDNSDNILNNYFEYNSSTQTNQFRVMNARQHECFIAVWDINISSYKGVKNYNANASSNLEVDFPTIANSETATHNRIQNSNTNSTKNEVLYSYNQTKTSQVNTSNIQFASIKTSANSYSKTVFSSNISNQFEGNFGGKNQSNSNNVSNAFSSNNTLSLTTDLSENNSPMLIDGETNPGDPGVPVGDGTWVLFILLGIYMFRVVRNS
jgi:hypothetical protein